MAEFDFEDDRYDDIPSYARILKGDYEDKGYNYPLFFGRMRRILADIAFEKKEYETSCNLYAEGLALIRQHGGYGVWLIDRELESLEQKLQMLPPEIAREWGVRLKEYWGKQKPEEKYAKMVSWCDRQIIQARIRPME
jgi:hypothetical protein